MSVLVLTTGGTIGALAYPDPVHPPVFSEMPPPSRDFVREVVMKEFAGMGPRCLAAEPRDSKNIDAAYRDTLAAMMRGADEQNILLTHGTDAILDSADYFDRLQKGGDLAGRIIVLTGAMVPLANGPQSDGYRNLAFAMRQLQEGLRPGIYIVLSDYADARDATSWAPRLYPYQAGFYTKFYDPDDGSRSRLQKI